MREKHLQKIEVVIETNGEAIDLEELTDFFYHFRAVYSAAIEFGALEPNSNPESIVNTIKERHYGSDWMTITKLAHQNLGESNIGVIDIKRQNPITIVFEGVAIALTVAVILSGGELKMGPLKVKLPPLGEGVSSLRRALGRRPSKKH